MRYSLPLSMKMTKTTLKKLESIFLSLNYSILYEKGSFQSGYCLVEGEQIIVINKFFDTEARINCLIELLDYLEIKEDMLEGEDKKVFKKLGKTPKDLSELK